jgi:transposase
MRAGRPIPPLKITASEREALEALSRGHDRRMAARASAILASADGLSNKTVASRCGMTKQTVGKWRARFRTRRVEGLRDDPRPGAPRPITDQQVADVVRRAGQLAPNGTAWTTRSMARAVGLTQTAISRIWRMHGVKPASAFRRPVAVGDPARPQTLGEIHGLLRDARSLRGAGHPELDPLLALATDAIERALEKRSEPARARYAQAGTSLRNARNLLAQAEATARNVERAREAVATAAMAAIRSVGEDVGDGPGDEPPRRGLPARPQRRLR